MEEEQLAPDPNFVTGFNKGYLLAKHAPDLAALLTANPNDHSPYFNGLVGGKEEYDKEMRAWAKSFSSRAPEKEDQEPGQAHER